MAVYWKQNGVSSASGTPDSLSAAPFASDVQIIYVDSAASGASDGNTGFLEEKPKATVFGAVTGAYAEATDAVSQVILCKPTHRETISSAQTVSKTQLQFKGIGIGAARPTFTSSVVGVAITVSGAFNRFENLYFAASSAATTSRILAGADGIEVKDCWLDCGASDTADSILISGTAATNFALLGTTFKVTAAGAARGFLESAVSNGLRVEDNTFDGGSYGWAGNAFAITAAVLGFRFFNNTFENYSDGVISSATAKGIIGGYEVDRTSSFSWSG